MFVYFLTVQILLIPTFNADRNFSISSSPICESASDCPTGFSNCTAVSELKKKRCVNARQICIGGKPELPIKSCARSRDCTKNVTEYEGWCDFETKFCCEVDPLSRESPMCPDRVTPLYGQEKCEEYEEGMIYSGKSEQKGGFCYKGYSCPPKITRPKSLKFGTRTFRTNIDCDVGDKIASKYEFMFCHNETGNLWVMGKLNMNGDEVIKHWTLCHLNKDCLEGQVCVKEDICRYRCYDDPVSSFFEIE
ncbi:hypothetical protein CAEBREN_32129 [Caenorhabditis brenneri]|uniref:Domain of unknown function DX domain-containing protein n=1 Tax=Caenorhabditis brenneri TaxID=135651 RepID=G0NTD7_CAEBE|nr:hypothetical protein CAEBREN_32129 [Caenorhabditis brenneri]